MSDVLVITGNAQRIGLAITQAMIKDHIIVCVVRRMSDELKALKEKALRKNVWKLKIDEKALDKIRNLCQFIFNSKN